MKAKATLTMTFLASQVVGVMSAAQSDVYLHGIESMFEGKGMQPMERKHKERTEEQEAPVKFSNIHKMKSKINPAVEEDKVKALIALLNQVQHTTDPVDSQKLLHTIHPQMRAFGIFCKTDVAELCLESINREVDEVVKTNADFPRARIGIVALECVASHRTELSGHCTIGLDHLDVFHHGPNPLHSDSTTKDHRERMKKHFHSKQHMDLGMKDGHHFKQHKGSKQIHHQVHPGMKKRAHHN